MLKHVSLKHTSMSTAVFRKWEGDFQRSIYMLFSFGSITSSQVFYVMCDAK